MLLLSCGSRAALWKAVAGLALTDEAFHPTVLVLWRNRLRASAAPDRIFDAVRKLVAATGAVSGRDRRVLNSTVLDDAVARQPERLLPPPRRVSLGEWGGGRWSRSEPGEMSAFMT